MKEIFKKLTYLQLHMASEPPQNYTLQPYGLPKCSSLTPPFRVWYSQP